MVPPLARLPFRRDDGAAARPAPPAVLSALAAAAVTVVGLAGLWMALLVVQTLDPTGGLSAGGSAALAARLWLRTPEPPPRPAVARVLDEALRRQVVLGLRFADRDGRVTERAVEPVALAATGGHWHLLGWCRLRTAPRWFRTDRILAAHLSAEPSPEHDPATLFGTPPPDARPVRLR